MIRTILSLFLCLLVAGISSAQEDTSRQKDTEAIFTKLKQLDLMNQILPMLMTKDQLKKILPVVEKARQRVKQAQLKEYEALKKFEGRITEARKKAIDSGQVPGRQLLNEIIKMFQAMEIARTMIADENTDAIIAVFKSTLNEGQIKAAANDLNPKLFDPSLKPEEMSADQKLRFFVKEIFLDPAAYDVLVILSQKQ